MSPNKFATAIALAMLSLLLLIAPAHASTATVPKPIGGVKPSNPAGLGIQIAVNTILAGVGWIMDEGTKTDKKVPEQPAEGSPEATAGISNGTAVGTQTAPNSVYPMEYYIAGKAFTSVEHAKEYILGSYLKQQGLKRTRKRDGLYFDDVKVYFGNYSGSQSSIGKFVVSVQAGGVNIDYPNKVGGFTYSYTGSIFYRGTESTMTTEVSDSYIKAREEAKKAVEQAIAQAQASVTTAPSITDDNRVGTGTGTGTGTNVDTSVGTGTGTNTGTQTNTGTKPIDTPKPFEIPTFCGWASIVCDFVDWFKDEPKPPQQEISIIDEKPPTRSANDFDVMYLRFGGQCPAPVTHNIGLNNATFTIDLTPLCRFILLVRPVILAMAYFMAIGIIANAIRDT